MGDPEHRWRWGLIIAMGVLGMVQTIHAAQTAAGWPAAARTTLINLALFLAVAVGRRDRLLLHAALFGLIAGCGELAADAYSVVVKRTLVYPPEPLIWASPAYMPLSWTVLLAPMGFVASRLTARLGLAWASVVMILVGASYVPIFEFLARGAGYWDYQHCRMILGAVPLYVIAAEGIILGALPWLMRDLERQSVPVLFWRAMLESLVMLLATVVAFWLLA